IGAALGDGVDKPAGASAELGRGADRDHLEFLDRFEANGERRALAAALLAEERVIGVGAVNREIVLDPFVPVDRDLVAVRALDDRYTGRKLHKLAEIAPVDRQVLD